MNITFESKRGIRLAGILEHEQAEKCVIISYGFLSNKDYDRYASISKSLQKEGYAVLRFDYGGHGESEEADISIEGFLADLKAAIELMRKRYSRIGLIGFSLGGYCSLKLGNYADAIVVWAANTASGEMPQDYSQKTATSYIYDYKGRTYTISKQHEKERQMINTKALLSPLTTPTQLIHGTADTMIPVQETINAGTYLQHGKVTIIEGADHKFENKLEEGIRATIEWFSKYL